VRRKPVVCDAWKFWKQIYGEDSVAGFGSIVVAARFPGRSQIYA
jgi:hypothetical protein